MLEVSAIDLHYGAAQALRGVSLTAELGEVTCVLGRNGVGKTSLLRALVGQHPISAGSIVWEGADITKLKPYERARRGIAYVPQGREIFPLLSVEENLKTGFAPLKRDQRDIPDDVFTLFPVLRDRMNQTAGTLSGGEQQMLAVSRALMARPRLLLLDEPSLGVAPLIVRGLFKALASLKAKGMTMLLVEQDVRMALSLADRAYVLRTGSVVLSGTAAALKADQEGVAAAYLGTHKGAGAI